MISARGMQPATAVAMRARSALLSHAEEIALARAWRDKGDVEARNRLVRAHLAFAMSKARSRSSSTAEIEDLEQVAVLGLIAAADRFDPDLGWRFSTYAAFWVMAGVKGHAIKNHTIVQVGHGSYRRMFFSLRRTLAKITAEMSTQTGQEPSRDVLHAEAARRLGVEVEHVERFMAIITAGDVSLNTPVLSSEGAMVEELIDRLEDRHARSDLQAEENDNDRAMRRAVAACLEDLTPRERMIIERRHLDEDNPATLQDLAQVLSLTRERVRQIEGKALEKIARSLRRNGTRPHHFGLCAQPEVARSKVSPSTDAKKSQKR